MKHAACISILLLWRSFQVKTWRSYRASQRGHLMVQSHWVRLRCFPAAPQPVELIAVILDNDCDSIRSAMVRFRNVPEVALHSVENARLFYFWQMPWPTLSRSTEPIKLTGSQTHKYHKAHKFEQVNKVLGVLLEHSWWSMKMHGERTKTTSQSRAQWNWEVASEYSYRGSMCWRQWNTDLVNSLKL